jgi:hypothetical protein
VTQIVICVITFFVGPCGGAIAAYLSKRDSRTGNVEVDEEFAGTCCLVCGVSVPVCSFVAWLGVAIFILTIVIGKSANFDMSWPDLLFGVPIPFRVPSLSLPTALFSFTYGSIRLVLVLGKLSAPCKMLDSLAGFSKIKMPPGEAKVSMLWRAYKTKFWLMPSGGQKRRLTRKLRKNSRKRGPSTRSTLCLDWRGKRLRRERSNNKERMFVNWNSGNAVK